MVATAGNELSDNSTLANSLAYGNINDNNYIEFVIGSESPVSLGLLYNLSSYNRVNVSSFSLPPGFGDI